MTTGGTMRRIATKKPIPTAAAAAVVLFAAATGGVGADRASAAEGALPPIDRRWAHEGLFGTYDRAAAQRGFQVYREVCQGCHALKYVAFRHLTDLGFSEEAAQAIAAEYTVVDGPNDEGEMFERPARLSDPIPPPYPNDAAARAANGGAYPPNLSLLTKARADGEDYVFSVLVGYHEGEEEAPPGQYYNAYFPGNFIAMPQPLYEEGVAYTDGTEATIPQMAADVTQFLAWAAEPTLEQRKGTGIKVMLFLIILSGLLYATKRKIWADVH
jgi:ubiquinol-cytochrome c reductase cytochrome c1 subunit